MKYGATNREASGYRKWRNAWRRGVRRLKHMASALNGRLLAYEGFGSFRRAGARYGSRLRMSRLAAICRKTACNLCERGWRMACGVLALKLVLYR